MLEVVSQCSTVTLSRRWNSTWSHHERYRLSWETNNCFTLRSDCGARCAWCNTSEGNWAARDSEIQRWQLTLKHTYKTGEGALSTDTSEWYSDHQALCTRQSDIRTTYVDVHLWCLHRTTDGLQSREDWSSTCFTIHVFNTGMHACGIGNSGQGSLTIHWTSSGIGDVPLLCKEWSERFEWRMWILWTQWRSRTKSCQWIHRLLFKDEGSGIGKIATSESNVPWTQIWLATTQSELRTITAPERNGMVWRSSVRQTVRTEETHNAVKSKWHASRREIGTTAGPNNHLNARIGCKWRNSTLGSIRWENRLNNAD